MKWLRVFVGTLSIIVVTATGVYFWADLKYSRAENTLQDRPSVEFIVGKTPDQIALGRRIVEIRNDCLGCHGADLGGKRFIDDPALGKIFAPDLTPTGLQSWTDADIAVALRYGLNREGRPLLFMPSHEYQHLAKEDIAAVIAYLRSLPAGSAPREASSIGPMAKVLFAFGKMPTLFPATSGLITFDRSFATKPAEAADFAFGKYLARSACMGCHGKDFAGGPIPGGPPSWPAATDISAKALASWTEAEFVKAMKQGISKAGKPLLPPMPIQGTARMTETEIKALWTYLRKGE